MSGLMDGFAEMPVDLDRLRQLEALGKRTGRDLLGNILKVFRTENDRRIQILQESVENEDWTTIKDIAHTMKGGCGQFGATLLMHACKSLEDASEAQDTALSRIRLEELRAEHQKVLQAIASL